MSFEATYDACVLHPAGLRDLLVRLAITGLFRAHWSADILDEMVRSILRRRPDLTSAQLERTRELMCDAVPDCVTTGYEALIDGIELPDPDDRHVLAAAIRSGSQVIVTENTADFPADVLDRYDIEAQTPDAFVLHLIDLSPTTVFSVIDAQAAALRDPPFTVDQLLDRLASSGFRDPSLHCEVSRQRAASGPPILRPPVRTLDRHLACMTARRTNAPSRHPTHRTFRRTSDQRDEFRSQRSTFRP